MTLQQYFAKYISGESEQIEALCSLFSERTLKKKEFLLREGDTCKFEAFITQGLLLTYHIDRNGDEQVLFFGRKTGGSRILWDTIEPIAKKETRQNQNGKFGFRQSS